MDFNLTVRAVVYDDFGDIVEEKQVNFEEFRKSDLISDFEAFIDDLEDDYY